MPTNNPTPEATINCKGDIYPAAVCPICRGRVYPPDALEDHLKHHAHVARWGYEPGPVTRRKMMQATR